MRLQRSIFGLLIFCLCCSIGCNSLQLNSTPPEKTDKLEKGEKDKTLALPYKHHFRLSQYVFISDFEVKQDLPLFRELATLREQVHRELKLPSANSLVQVYLFEDRDRYERYMKSKYPELPKRRAFFVAQPKSVGGDEDLLVYTYWGDRVREDLRHELTHALLHSVLKDVPLWLDEGLAEYFEVPPDWRGSNYHHVEQIRRASHGPFKPDLGRLEKLGQVQQMSPAEYREAWAWVHLMLHDKPEAKAVLVQYLQQLRTNPNPGPLQPRLAEVFPALNAALERHLALLDATPPTTVPTVQR